MAVKMPKPMLPNVVYVFATPGGTAVYMQAFGRARGTVFCSYASAVAFAATYAARGYPVHNQVTCPYCATGAKHAPT
jgi:uncharacterized Zn-finger protein